MKTIAFIGYDPTQLNDWQEYVVSSVTGPQEVKVITTNDPDFGPEHPDFWVHDVLAIFAPPETFKIDAAAWTGEMMAVKTYGPTPYKFVAERTGEQTNGYALHPIHA